MPSQVSGQTERGLCLLSIGTTIFEYCTVYHSLLSPDGGGIRGLSPLLILKEILYRIQQKRRLQELPRPCDIFDLAGGTSTGGYVAVIVSILQYLVDLNRQAYRDNALPATNVN